MTSEWKTTCLGDHLSIKHGYAFEGEYFKDEPPGDILLTPGNFKIGGGFKHDSRKFYEGPVEGDYVLSPGDIIVTMTDLSKETKTLGYPAIVPKSDSAQYLHNQRLGLVQIESDEIDRRFLFYLMRSQSYRNEILAGATGTTVKHTAPERIEKFEFDLPPIEYQRQVGNILGTLDDKIDLNRKMNRTLEAMARAIFKSWFVDFDPVRAKMAGEEPTGVDPETAELFPDRLVDSELGQIPEGWEVQQIGEVVKTYGGGTPRTKNPEYWENPKHYWATPKDLSGQEMPILLDTDRKISDAGREKVTNGERPVGTLLMSKRAPIGYLAIARVPTSINQGFIAMEFDGPVSKYFMLNWLDSNMDLVKSRANGSTFKEISQRDFKSIELVLPPERVIRQFDELVGPFYEKIEQNMQESGVLENLRDVLLPELLSGESLDALDSTA